LDLTDKSLVAIVGHTGAGKSSLLEAITFALFGEATYGGKAYEDLSSDGRSEITVQLVFTVGDERFQMLRTVRPDRNGKFGNKVVYLRRVDDEGRTLTHREGVRDVDTAVTALLGGMTREQFCQAVLLAQNRFAALLEANPAQREALLDTLLGLNALHDARTALQKTRSAAARNIVRLQDRRSYLPSDPVAEARDAEAKAKAMGEIAARAKDGGTRLDALADQAAGLDQQAADLERAAALRSTANGPSGLESLAETVQNLQSLCELDDTLTSIEKKATNDLNDAESALQQATKVLARAEAQHGASGHHPVVAQQLDNLESLLEEKPGHERAVADTEAHVVKLRGELTPAQAKAAEANLKSIQHRKTHKDAHDAAQQAANAAARVEQAMKSVSPVVERLLGQVRSVEQLSGELEAARSALADAQGALEPLRERRADARRELEETSRADSAAAAAHGCRPGDNCPVCDRCLPKSWVAPAAVDLNSARERVANAEDALEKAERRLRSNSDRHAGAVAGLRSALGAVVSTHAELPALATEHGLTAPPGPAGALLPDESANDDAFQIAAEAAGALPNDLFPWLDDLRGELDTVQLAKNVADNNLQQTTDQLTLAEMAQAEADKDVADTEMKLATAETRYKGEVEAGRACEQRLSTTLAGIDERWRALIDLRVPESLEAAKRTLTDDQAAVDGAVRTRDKAEGAVKAKHSGLQELDGKRARELTAPLAGARAKLRTLTDLVNDLCGRVQVPVAPVADKEVSASVLHSVASELETVAQRGVDAAIARTTELRQQINELTAPASEVVSALVSLMTEADPEGTQFEESPDPENPLSNDTRSLVQQVVGGAKRLATHASSEARDAQKKVKVAAELDERIEALNTWSADLDGAIHVLKKDNFPGWARKIKMSDLVETASEHLSEMTDSRFRFDPSLQISDEVAGVVRKATTLSGGEKFEASLALALGVSEIAGRSGVRIETLFLDEGFSGLDQAHLNRALDALEREVETGRSIVLITHIGAVADRIQDVLLIQPDGAGGSTTRWLDEDERFELGADLDLAVP
jgi:exonuclease SbcC